MFLTRAEVEAIDATVARVESRTGVQVATAVVGKSDTYVELPWKAFALGASLAALGVVAADLRHSQWATAGTGLLHAVTILGVASASALLAVFVPAVGRLLLQTTRRDLEVRQYAQALFLTRELFATRQRTGVLILISLFERRIEILPDLGLHTIGDADWRAIVARMTPLLRQARPSDALQEGLDALEALLMATKVQPDAGSARQDELPNRPIEEHGA